MARHFVSYGRTLITTLDSWKNGKTAELARRIPPIRFVDDDLLAG